MTGLLDFFSAEAGQARRRALDEGIGEFANFLLGPTGIPQRLNLLGEVNPVQGVGRAMQAGSQITAPNVSTPDRIGATGQMLSEVAGVVAPSIAASRGALPVANALQEGLLGFSQQPRIAAQQFFADESGALSFGKAADASSIFGAGTTRQTITDDATGGFMEILKREDGPTSVLELFVPENMRGTGSGKRLLAGAMQENPAFMGQVSSKAAAKNAFDAGRRPFGKPNATLQEVFDLIDENSSVNLMIDRPTSGLLE